SCYEAVCPVVFIFSTYQYGEGQTDDKLKSATVAYARKNIPQDLPQKVKDEQGRMHITYSENEFTNDITDNALHYRLRVACEARGYELNAASPAAALYTVAELKGLFDAATEIDFTVSAEEGEKRLM